MCWSMCLVSSRKPAEMTLFGDFVRRGSSLQESGWQWYVVTTQSVWGVVEIQSGD